MKDSSYADMEESEKLVAHYLKELNLWWIYESPVFVYDEKERPRVWTPDFYLPKLGMYVEVCGSENAKSYEYREQIYKKNDVYVIFVHLDRSDQYVVGARPHRQEKSLRKQRQPRVQVLTFSF